MNAWGEYKPRFFKPEEFREFWELVNVELLIKLDAFRALWELPVQISQHPAALGRRLGTSRSWHNLDRTGLLMAADIQPERIVTRADLERARDCAVKVGFTGVGVYPHWQPTPGIHVDVRGDRKPGAPAQWGAIRPEPHKPQTFTTVERALQEMTA